MINWRIALYAFAAAVVLSAIGGIVIAYGSAKFEAGQNKERLACETQAKEAAESVAKAWVNRPRDAADAAKRLRERAEAKRNKAKLQPGA